MVITAEEVKIIDANSEELGVAVLQLMENAGAATAQAAIDSFPEAQTIAICCGTGNMAEMVLLQQDILHHIIKK